MVEGATASSIESGASESFEDEDTSVSSIGSGIISAAGLSADGGSSAGAEARSALWSSEVLSLGPSSSPVGVRSRGSVNGGIVVVPTGSLASGGASACTDGG